MRDEWAKIQGRFIDLIVDTSREEQIDLISRAIESDHDQQQPSTIASMVARFACRDRTGDAEMLADRLNGCWPLHPIVACLLGPISRRRFGQNQQHIGFPHSSEADGFRILSVMTPLYACGVGLLRPTWAVILASLGHEGMRRIAGTM